MPLGDARFAVKYGLTADVTCGTKANEETTLNIIDEINQDSQRSDLPEFRAGDTVKVNVRVTEGGNSRIQVFQGVVLLAAAQISQTPPLRFAKLASG